MLFGFSLGSGPCDILILACIRIINPIHITYAKTIQIYPFLHTEILLLEKCMYGILVMLANRMVLFCFVQLL